MLKVTSHVTILFYSNKQIWKMDPPLCDNMKVVIFLGSWQTIGENNGVADDCCFNHSVTELHLWVDRTWQTNRHTKGHSLNIFLLSRWKRISQMSLMIDNCNSVSFCFFLIGDRSRGRMLVSQKRPIRLMTIYDTESAKPVLLMSAVYRYKPNLNIVHFISWFLNPKNSNKYWETQN